MPTEDEQRSETKARERRVASNEAEHRTKEPLALRDEYVCVHSAKRPNAKLTDDEERAKDVRIGTLG